MYQLITTKGRKSADNIETLAAWWAMMQPSSTTIVHGDLEAELDEHVNAIDNTEWDDKYEAAVANAMRWALRLEEAMELDLTVNNGNVYLAGFGGGHAGMVYLRQDVDCVTLVDGVSGVSRRLLDNETLADVLAAVQRGE